MISSLTDPGVSLVLLVPAITSLSQDKGLRLLASLVTSSWLSHGLKWSLREPRPYWSDVHLHIFGLIVKFYSWYHQTQDFYFSRDLRQSWQTCEVKSISSVVQEQNN